MRSFMADYVAEDEGNEIVHAVTVFAARAWNNVHLIHASFHPGKHWTKTSPRAGAMRYASRPIGPWPGARALERDHW